MAPSSSSIPSLSPPLHPPPFTPIMECEREGNEDEESQECYSYKASPNECCIYKKGDNSYTHNPTPLHQTSETGKGKSSNRKRAGTDHHNPAGAGDDDFCGVSCNNCRPTTREKISVVPLDASGTNRQAMTSPNGLFRSIFSLVKKSPRLSSDGLSTAAPPTSREEQWKIVAAELSHKLIQTTRKRDEAIQEASKVKYSMAEIEKKLNKLEIYCHTLKSGLDECSNISAVSPHQINKTVALKHETLPTGHQDKVVEHFLVSVSEARSTVRFLARSLTLQLRRMGSKVYDRVSLLLQPYDVKVSLSRNPRALMIYLEALLNKVFFEDFESVGFQKGSVNQILNPIDRCEANFASFSRLQRLSWEDVLNKGTKHFSEEFSKFCDRKMSEIVAMLGWNRAWPEPLLQAFFGASKAVWLVHLLANSVHPSLPIFRVDKDSTFDSIYMEDMGGDKARKLVPAMVRIMVVPGFYVYGNVVKCKVLCRYHNNCNGMNGNDDIIEVKGLNLTPSPQLCD